MSIESSQRRKAADPADRRNRPPPALIRGRTAERRVIEMCDRFGVDTFVSALDAALERNRRAMAELIKRTIPEEELVFEDYVCDDGLGYGPFPTNKVNSSNFSLSGGQAGSPHMISVIPGLRSRYSETTVENLRVRQLIPSHALAQDTR
jgi:hypothetical protein